MKLNIFFIFIINFCFCQEPIKINFDLKSQLDDILKFDQIFREYSDSETSDYRKSEIVALTNIDKKKLDENLCQIINETDSINLIKVEKIIKKHGYPGKSLVGTPTNIACWYVIQHSKKIKDYFEIIKKSGELGEIPNTNVATMQDRMLMNDGLEQIYGTQGAGRLIINDAGKEEFYNFIWPIKDLENVNEFRKKAGFKTSVEENSKRIGIDYKIVTLEDYKKLKIVIAK